MVDYKFNYIIRTGNKTIIKVTFYQGIVSTEDELGIDNVLRPVTQYRRKRKLGSFKFPFEGQIEDLKLRDFLNRKCSEESILLNDIPISAQVI
jgi:hypothetical protein